jgi:hypothetical protein
MTISNFSLMFSQEELFEFNSNLLETNLFNLLLLFGLLVYGYSTVGSQSLAQRQLDILQVLENTQKDLQQSATYYQVTQKGFFESLVWLQFWRDFYQKEKEELIETKYQQLLNRLSSTFRVTESLISTLEKKAFLSLQRYILFLTTSKILRKFLLLSSSEKGKLLETVLTQLGGEN